MKVGKLNWMKYGNLFNTKIKFGILFLSAMPACGIFESGIFGAGDVGQSIIIHKKSTPSSPDDPILPQAYLDTRYVPSTKPPTIVKAGDDLQEVINYAMPGDTLMLEPGAKFVGNFFLPKKSGEGFIVIRSGALDGALPAEGTRIGPQHAYLLPKIITPNDRPALSLADGAHHYRFIAVEFTLLPSVQKTYNIITTGDQQTTVEELAHDLIFDRVYIHGHPTAAIRRGIALNSASTAVINSYISDFHEPGQDSQAIMGWNGPGPFKIVNNYLEGAGENIMFGGSPAHIPNLIPSDIEFRNNHCYKPLSWKKDDPSYAGRKWSIKNLFEIKNGQRILVEGNIFENNWAESQNGYAILFTVRAEDGSMPWAVCKDITFINNIIKHSASAINISGRDDLSPQNARGFGGRIKIANNLFDDIDGKKWGGGSGTFIQIVNGPPNIQVIHNTAAHSGNIGSVDVLPKAPGFVFTDNVVFNNDYGFHGSDKGTGTSALDYYFPGAIFKRNVIIGGSSTVYPSDNYFPPDSDAKNAIGFTDQGSNKYSSVEAVKNKHSNPEGKRPGVDLDALNQAVYGKK